MSRRRPNQRAALASARTAGNRWLLSALVLAGALLAAATAAPVASAHSSFLESTPIPGARLASPPAKIVMVYTEPLNERLTTVRLVDAGSGATVPAETRISAGRRLEVLPRERLAQGAYRIDWRSVSTIDAHIREGSVGFGVGTAALGGSVDVGGSPLEGAGPARVVFRWLFYAALFLFAGGLLNAALRSPRGSPGSWLTPADSHAETVNGDLARAVAVKAWHRTGYAAWIAFAAAVAVVAVETADATSGFAVGQWLEFLVTGTAGVSRLVLITALLAAALLVSRAPRTAAFAVVVAFGALSFGGHAGGADSRLLAVATNLVHLLAAAIWVGGITHIALAWVPILRTEQWEVRRAVISTVLPRFGQVALPAFVVVAATGLANALMQLGHVAELWSSAYGRVLLVKTGLVALIAAFSYMHAFRLRPQIAPAGGSERNLERKHRRLLGSEPIVAVTVLIASAVLVAFPVPPREVREAKANFGSVEACDPCPFAAPAPGELAVGAPLGDLTVGAWLRRQSNELVGTLRIINGKREPVAVSAEIAGARSMRSCGVGCWRFRLPEAATTVDVAAETGRGTLRARLPGRWERRSDAKARRLVAVAQDKMRSLANLKMTEDVRPAQGTGNGARGLYAFKAPDRMHFSGATNELITIGRQTWMRPHDLPQWRKLPPAEDPFRVRDGFRWTVFASTARLLEIDDRTAKVALFDYGYPVWYELEIDLRRQLVTRATLISPENRIRHRYKSFGKADEIKAPDSP